jgi:hypothetical protein
VSHTYKNRHSLAYIYIHTHTHININMLTPIHTTTYTLTHTHTNTQCDQVPCNSRAHLQRVVSLLEFPEPQDNQCER